MIKIAPATLGRSDDLRLSALSAELAGDRLVGVRYAVPAGVAWENYGGLEFAHEVDMGVEMMTESGSVLRLSWSTPGLEEGLALELDRDDTSYSDDLIDLVDVSGHPAWSGVLGQQVKATGMSFFVRADDSSVRPWAFRIGVSGGSSVTVALGVVDGVALRYMPDNLLVIFDESVARKYRITSDSPSAWGEDIL